jgi:hypothetical protein
MKKENINYIKRALDLHYCLDHYINENIKAGNTIYVFHLNSLTTDKKLFINTIWKHFRDRVLKNRKSKFCIQSGVGGVEKDSNGHWHIHLLVTYTDGVRADSTRYNKNTEIRALWQKLHFKYTGIELSDERVEIDPLDITRKDKLTKYISKPVKHSRTDSGSKSYLPKAFENKSSIRVSLGSANKLWCKNDMPSWKLSDKQVAEKLYEVWKEFKYKANRIHNLLDTEPVFA